MVAQESTAQKDEEIIISVVKEMTESMTGAQAVITLFSITAVVHRNMRMSNSNGMGSRNMIVE